MYYKVRRILRSRHLGGCFLKYFLCELVLKLLLEARGLLREVVFVQELNSSCMACRGRGGHAADVSAHRGHWRINTKRVEVTLQGKTVEAEPRGLLEALRHDVHVSNQVHYYSVSYLVWWVDREFKDCRFLPSLLVCWSLFICF